MAQSRIDLKTGDIRSHLIRMTIPMIWGIAAIVSLQLVDTYYVSQLGTDKLAAMSFTYPVTFFMFSIIMGFGIAMSSVTSRLIGEGKEEDVRCVTTHGLMLVFAVGSVLGLIGFSLHDSIYSAMGAGDEMRGLIYQYMGIWSLGVPFLAIPFVGNAAMRAAGNASTPAMIMVGMAILNALLAPVLVFGLFGFPRMELQGAAIATVFSQIVASIACLFVLAKRNKMLLPISNLHFNLFRDSVKRLIFIAIAAGLTSAINPFVNSIIISLLSKFGPEAVASFGIATRIEAFAFIILMALAVGMGPIIGQNFGARNFERVHETLRKAIGFSVLWSIGTAVILFAFARPIASIFSSDPVVVYYAAMSFMIIAPCYMFNNLINGWSSAFNAMGRPQMSLMMTIIRMIVLMIPAVTIGAHIGGVMGIFAAISIVNIVCGIGFHLWSRRACVQTEASLALKAS